jgi:flagellar basal body L-ring protein FlgH
VLVVLGIDKYLQDDLKKKNNNLEHQLTTVPVKIKMGGAKMITGRHWLTVNLLTNKLVDSCGGCYEE